MPSTKDPSDPSAPSAPGPSVSPSSGPGPSPSVGGPSVGPEADKGRSADGDDTPKVPAVEDVIADPSDDHFHLFNSISGKTSPPVSDSTALGALSEKWVADGADPAYLNTISYSSESEDPCTYCPPEEEEAPAPKDAAPAPK
jgi:hypothetical protein